MAWREDRVKFWAAIRRGVMTEAAAAGVSSPVGFRWFRHAGGVNPGLPATVSGRYLSFSEREDIALARAQGMGVREIARQLGRDPSTVSRELRRNASTCTYSLDYKASTTQWHAERRARRPKTAKLLTNDRLHEYVQDRLAGEIRTADGRPIAGPQGPHWKGRNKPHRGDRAWTMGWSPEQISRRLPAEFPDDESPCASVTRRSTRRSMSRAAALSSVNWLRPCRLAARFVFPGRGPSNARGGRVGFAQVAFGVDAEWTDRITVRLEVGYSHSLIAVM
ncbi:hypothetical protein Raf01_94480 [Rugosimonospora africana]|uniref:Transposase IS30-like HTH domain-containing protein n=1 Tax=Rugosimonospora africana TaxID=556532 RepID=A0A8J3R765_9ACTN|nr:hypothetical protein Raf01_94480 [Rugosimonospora africana]